MKRLLIIFSITLCSYAGFAQSDYIIHSGDKGFYLTHTVSPKEGFYTLSRIYNIPAKEIAAFNNIDLNAGLGIRQVVHIPLTNNFTQSAVTGNPVFYVVGEKEGLYRVSVKNGNVLMANLRKWNNLASDKLNPGQKLIVGFVSSEANTATTLPSQIITEPEKHKKSDPVVTAKETQPEKKTTPTQVAVKDAKGGYFKQQFEQQSRNAANKEITGNAGIFKTASGWEDGKYYALMDGVEPGTIVRVVNPGNSKAIYAKVLGAMSGISQNKNLDVRISSAAANALEIADTEKFVVRVNY